MSRTHRSWAEMREIIRAIVAESNPRPLETFQLSPSEEAYFRARSAKAIDALARKSSAFKSYYALPTAKPFGYVVAMSALVVVTAAVVAAYLYMRTKDPTQANPILATCATLGVAAFGWAVAGWITHRNTIRQNTNNLLFARFSQAPFGEAVHRFHAAFGLDITDCVTLERMSALRTTGKEDDRRAAASATYLLNYFEFIASGVLRGDLNQNIVRDNIRGVIVFYHDKCGPYIRTMNQKDYRTFANLIKIRNHYRDP